MMPANDSRVGVVMITHNRRDEVLRSLGHPTQLPERPRILLVDNGSTDGTSYAVAATFPQIDVLDAGGNRGAAGRTLGVQRLDAPYIALCDDDTWWEPGSLSRAAELFDRHPRLAVLTGCVLIGPENRLDPTCAEMQQSPLPRELGMPGAPLLGFLAGACVVRRRAFLEAGGFEPRLFLGGEEKLLAIDLVARGWWLCYVPELIVHHYPSPQRDLPRRRWHLVRNALWFAWLRRPPTGALRRTLRTALTEPWDWAALRGFTGAVAGLPWVLRERRPVPPEVERGLCLLESRHPRNGRTKHVSGQGHQRLRPAAKDPVPHV
jgi:N-acetylglucosaminyl-diphospho-decaprenol L-rhamnosyltransferase